MARGTRDAEIAEVFKRMGLETPKDREQFTQWRKPAYAPVVDDVVYGVLVGGNAEQPQTNAL